MIPTTYRSMKLTVGRLQVLMLVLLGIVVCTDVSAQTVRPASFTVPSKHQSFVVVTEVFQGGESAPVETHRIAFQDGIFYDFPSGDQRAWTMFDLPNSQVVLLNRHTQKQATASTESLIRVSAQAEASITDPQHRERLGMDATINPTSATGYEMTYKGTRYQVTASAPMDPEYAIQYGRFVDWACRLNISRPSGVPPFARMRLNAVMTQRQLLPDRIDVEMQRWVGEDSTPVTIRLNSRTVLVPEISDKIQKQIGEARKMRVTYQAIPWDQFER
ncbi:hypothetical protein SAMN06265222_101336 [Neorhodopirellula lusitana]|uniref:DUF4412 domain-containing protein n=1 Tax=Neorhodopirellula lusitana TaxID=445327 RepID=A0ABY1PP70_9BACT|nr:hypothetical protein [Neorhodopirellula lusitana]SMP39649.1 hypothetical protein SAMN06265222_101336 [Neorhodopirellula lusitana]